MHIWIGGDNFFRNPGILRLKINKVWGQIFVYFQLCPIKAKVYKNFPPHFITVFKVKYSKVFQFKVHGVQKRCPKIEYRFLTIHFM